MDWLEGPKAPIMRVFQELHVFVVKCNEIVWFLLTDFDPGTCFLNNRCLTNVMLIFQSDDHLLPSLKAMAKNAVDGLSITDLPQSSQQQSLSQQQLQTTAQQPTGPVGSSNISQTGS